MVKEKFLLCYQNNLASSERNSVSLVVANKEFLGIKIELFPPTHSVEVTKHPPMVTIFVTTDLAWMQTGDLQMKGFAAYYQPLKLSRTPRCAIKKIK